MDVITMAEREAKAQVIALAISSVMGSYPNLNRTAETTVINLTPEQTEKARDYFSKWLRSDPSDVQVNIKPVVLPVLWRQYWQWIVGIPAGIGVLGYLLGKK